VSVDFADFCFQVPIIGSAAQSEPAKANRAKKSIALRMGNILRL